MVNFRTAFTLAVIVASGVLAHTVPGIDSLRTQLAIRATNPIDSIYDNLDDAETDFINDHYKNLTAYNSTSCDQCKNKIRYGRHLIDTYPDKQHLVSLLLFKYCIFQNKGSESKCDNTDFFVSTQTKDDENFGDSWDSGVTSATSISFFDNDFLHMLKNFNVSSELDLEYYCYYRGSNACKQPKTPDVDELYGVDSWWPAKQPQHSGEPEYNRTNGELEKFNVLHFTDFHLQMRYTLGSESNCTQGLCCMPESFNKDLVSKGHNFTEYYKQLDPKLSKYAYSFYPDAKYVNDTYIAGSYYDYPAHRGFNWNSVPATTFGAYKCDLPEVLMNNSLHYISKAHEDKDFEFTIFTGDLVDHDVIHCDANTTKTAEIKSFQLIKHYLKNITVLPSLGNHDTFPYGQLSPIKYSLNNTYDWNDELMSELLVENGWLPESKAQQIKTHYSGFSYVTPRGLKVISLNSNCYYQKNLWSYIDLSTNADLFGQWEFLVNELVESEKIGQRVWIMAHIPVTDYDTLPIQAEIFNKIVKRFSPYTIANIFWGHTHRDQFHIAYSGSEKNSSEVVNMAWVAQSVTPYTNNNPSWRYYVVEDQSFNIYDSLNYYAQLNTTFTNGGAEPEWNFEYSARDTFDPEKTWPETSPLNASFWQSYVVEKLAQKNNTEFHQLYSDLQYRKSPYVPECKNGSQVSTDCWNENYCVVANFLPNDYADCLID
ncbi:putative sphingomyelin phosphodiesterase 1 precursor [Suhomyces tanzawaensis NRRL Y-17324]|uniref:Putative sphingomyelin phosphodiesterase 1 n=1 Tax=Suhomyces tanzawaensis NRRL Y-17324 TaxID=984487 RepID=A0A1E4SR03_9ASCO|nr:putative sphingomyelin phosphodiesterase 1 precursor [Suhomyces tanzawaensis NRRL Y-17324]ODV81925.1 putative sphingomyelin phosphodiesterase 1 precursor [Suhomyces tanzawaensis NRRL Y-17324]